ncbi:MAG: metallophosphoesterase [Nanoarchaeota archaeon]|nr:metallophosphoesterase [Nanoarchaeota archaeon]
MNRIIQFILFITVFLGLYLMLNSYAVLRLGGLLGIKRSVLYVILAVVTIAIPATMMIERRFQNLFTRGLYTIATYWMGVLLFLFISLMVYEIVSRFYEVPYAGFIILGIVAVLSVYATINAFTITVNEVVVPVEGLENEVTIAQMSDIHVGTIRNSGFLKNLAEKTNEIDPDIVMITGDLVDGSAPLYKSMFDPFNKLRAPVYFVTGNHETYEGVDKVYELFNDTKIQPLKNEVVSWDGIQVVGVDFSEDRAHLGNVLSGLKINKSKPAVLMYHPPISMDAAKKAGIDLQLSGHTHNGQIFPFNFFVWLVFNHVHGLYDMDGMWLHVSPGTGTWGPYMRLGSRNEITLIRLVKK